MTMTASGRVRVHSAATVAIPVNPPNATARAGMFVLSVGKGCSRVIRPHAVVSVRQSRPRHSGSTA